MEGGDEIPKLVFLRTHANTQSNLQTEWYIVLLYVLNDFVLECDVFNNGIKVMSDLVLKRHITNMTTSTLRLASSRSAHAWDRILNSDDLYAK